MTDENYEARAQAHLASIKRDMKASMEDAAVRAMHKVMAEFEAKSDERLMEDWGPGPHECHSLPAPQPAQQEPVAAECNFVGTKEWGRCSIEHHNLVQSEPHKWPGYQTRLLYTSHQPAQQQESVAWQLIETAPQDGTKILGWNEEFGARETQMNFYGEGSLGFAAWKSGKGPKESGWNWSEPKSNWGHTWEPTHWKPLLTPFNTTPPAAPVQDSDHEFKNFHRSLCERFGYVHDEKDWKRDLVSLEEWIAKKVQPQQEPAFWTRKQWGMDREFCEKPFTTDWEPLYTSHQPAQQQEPVAWNVIDPFGKIVATEKDAIRGWARIQGYKPTVESLLGFQEQGWRVVPTFPPAQRTWVGLTAEEIDTIYREIPPPVEHWKLSRAIEAKLKEKNA